jgi:hypothetical protein
LILYNRYACLASQRALLAHSVDFALTACGSRRVRITQSELVCEIGWPAPDSVSK